LAQSVGFVRVKPDKAFFAGKPEPPVSAAEVFLLAADERGLRRFLNIDLIRVHPQLKSSVYFLSATAVLVLAAVFGG
jgi:hypothetical protein